MFGDSLSNTGKMYKKMRGYLPSSPPYFNGRFSNGPVWLEQLRDERFPGLVMANEAEGGATVVAYNHLGALNGWLGFWSWDPKYQAINNFDYEIDQFLKKDKFRPDDLGRCQRLSGLWVEHRAGYRPGDRYHPAGIQPDGAQRCAVDPAVQYPGSGAGSVSPQHEGGGEGASCCQLQQLAAAEPHPQAGSPRHREAVRGG